MNPSLPWKKRKKKHKRKINNVKLLPPQKLFFIFIQFSLYSPHLILFLFVMSHLLSFMCSTACQGRLDAGACALTAIVQYQYCDGWGATRPHISAECKDNWKEEASQTWHPSHFKESLLRRNKTSPDKAKLVQDKSKQHKTARGISTFNKRKHTGWNHLKIKKGNDYDYDYVLKSSVLLKELLWSYVCCECGFLGNKNRPRKKEKKIFFGS